MKKDILTPLLQSEITKTVNQITDLGDKIEDIEEDSNSYRELKSIYGGYGDTIIKPAARKRLQQMENKKDVCYLWLKTLVTLVTEEEWEDAVEASKNCIESFPYDAEEYED